MKRIIVVIMAMLVPFFAIGQKVQTKTEKINDETTRTFSYYLDENGNQVRHGKYVITWIVNRNDYKVNNKLECNYKKGLLHGKLTYSANKRIYNAALSLKSKDGYRWILNSQELDNFTVEMYEGYMTGDINVTFQGWWPNETNFRCKAVKGVLMDDSELVITERPRKVFREQLKYFSDAEELKRYRNILSASSPNPNLQDIPEQIYFDFPADSYGGWESYIIKLPRYVDKPYDRLGDIEEYVFLTTYQGNDMNAISRLDEKIIQSYYLSSESRDTLHEQYVLARQRINDIVAEEERMLQQKKDVYQNAYSKAETIAKEFQNRKCWLGTVQNLYTSEGYVYPVVVDTSVKNLLYDGYYKVQKDISDDVYNLKWSEYDYKGKIKGKREVQYTFGISKSEIVYEEMTDEIVKTMTDYLQLLIDSDVSGRTKKLTDLCMLENGIIEKMYSITNNYTKSTYSGGKIYAGSNSIPKFYNSNCTTKVVSKKKLYNAYTEVAAYIYQQLSQCTLDEHIELMSKFSKVVDVMHQGIKSSTKDVEKALKNASTPEEKLNAFLSM